MPRLLLVTYEFPPKGGPGVQRPAKLCKYLARAGWDVSVLTVADPPTALADESLLRDIPDSVTVLRAWSAEPTRVLLWLRGLLGRPPAGGSRGADGGRQSSGGTLSGASPGTIRAVKALFVPDEKRFWLPWARRAGLRHLAAHPADVILSTGPPHTAHLVAMALSRRTGIPFVIDFRDPWIGNVSLVTPTPLHRWLHARSERRVASRAAAMVTVSDAMTERLRERYPGARVLTIPNGFDAEDLPPRATGERDRSRSTAGRLRLVYSGTFSPPRTPDLFFGGLAAAEASDPAIAESLQVVMVGPGEEVQRVAAEYGLKTPVEGRGYVGHEQALEALAGADVALLVLSPGRESEVSLTGKLFEYLGMRLPVLAVVGEGEVSRLAGRIAGITVADPSDPEAVGTALIALTNAWKAGTLKGPNEEDVAVFDRRSQAERFSALLEDVARGGAPNA